MFTAIAIVLVYFVFKDVDLQKLWGDIISMNVWWVLLSLGFATLGYILRMLRWVLLIEPLGYNPSKKNTFFALMFGYFANLALPRIGEVARCGVLYSKEKIPVDKLLGTVIIERAFDLLTLALLGIIVFFCKIDLFGTFLYEHVFIAVIQLIQKIPFAYVVLVFGVIAVAAVFLLVSKNTHVLSKKILQFLSGILEGIRSVYTMKKRWRFLFYTLFIWLMYWAMTYTVFFAIPATAHLTMIDGLFILIVGGLGMSAPVQGGIGAFHYVVGQALVLYGLDFLSEGLLFATISHGSQTVFVVLLGIVSIIILSKKNKKHEI
ncbi:MAG: flippase-like domain-containing protein [Bacteroidales bacterium]|nr:flippase-like domain-containing protein [Bacteroidales bacterium]HPY82600.1 lysylphosphatidylglycerol synthase transmembrane domain-containing protein [Bacteroidales bacterium]